MSISATCKGRIEQARKRIGGVVRRSDFSFIGILFPQIWFSRILQQNIVFDGTISLRTIIYCSSIALFFLIFFLAFTSFGKKELLSKKEHPAIHWLAAACMAIAPLLFALQAPSQVYIAAAVLGGLGFGWNILQWGAVFSKVDTEVSVFYLFLSLGLSTILGVIVEPLSNPAIAGTLFVFALLSALLATRANKFAPKNPTEPEIRFDRETLSSFWKLFIGIGIFAFVFGYTGAPEMYEGAGIFFLLQRLGNIIIVAASIYWVFSRRTRAYASKLWSSVLLVMAATLILLSFRAPEAQSVGFMLLLTAQSFAKVLLLAILADIAHHSKWHPYAVFSAGFILFTLPLLTGSALSAALTGFDLMNSDLMIALAMLACSLILLLNSTNFYYHRIFFDLEENSVEASLEENIADICRELTQEYQLSLREAEVLSMLARGRTRSYIASALFISENTVKAHAKNIYAKMDIHSKQELLDIFHGSLKESMQISTEELQPSTSETLQ